MTSGVTERDRAKADRHAAILREAARLFAERGFSGVSLEDLGGAAGVSGPAVYRHFAGKQALLGAILVRVSERPARAAGGACSSAPRRPARAAARRSSLPRRLRPGQRRRHPRAGPRPRQPHRRRPPPRAPPAARLRRALDGRAAPTCTRSRRGRAARARARLLRAHQLDAAQRQGVRDSPADSTVRGILAAMATSALTV